MEKAKPEPELRYSIITQTCANVVVLIIQTCANDTALIIQTFLYVVIVVILIGTKIEIPWTSFVLNSILKL